MLQRALCARDGHTFDRLGGTKPDCLPAYEDRCEYGVCCLQPLAKHWGVSLFGSTRYEERFDAQERPISLPSRSEQALAGGGAEGPRSGYRPSRKWRWSCRLSLAELRPRLSA